MPNRNRVTDHHHVAQHPLASNSFARNQYSSVQIENHQPRYSTNMAGHGPQVQHQMPNENLNINRHISFEPSFAEHLQPLQPRQVATRQALPKDLPIFSGRAEEWPIFISQYESSTNLCGYSNCENLIRLQRALRGKALEAVECELVLPEEVPSIIDTLRRRFGNPEIIIHNLLTKVRSQPTLKPERLDGLIEFAQLVKNICAIMKSSQLHEGHLKNPILLQELCEKLPAQQRLLWGMYVEVNQDISIKTFSDWFKKLSNGACNVTSPQINTSEMKSTKSGQKGVFAHAYVSSNQPKYVNNDQHDDLKLNYHQQSRPSSISAPESRCEPQRNTNTSSPSRCQCCKAISSHTLKSSPKFMALSRNERWSIIKENRLCYKCFGKHFSNKCSSKKVCEFERCDKMHHKLLHNQSTSSAETSEIVDACNTHYTRISTILYRIVPVRLFGNGTTVVTYAFLDEGSSITLMDQTLADALNLKSTADRLCLKWTANTTRIEEKSIRANVRISAKPINSKSYELRNVRTVDTLCLPHQSLDYDTTISKFPYLKGIPFEGYANAVPQIMIGLDNYKVAIPLKTKDGPWNKPSATKTRLGWIVFGPLNKESPSDNTTSISSVHHSFHTCECQLRDENIQDLVKNYFFY